MLSPVVASGIKLVIAKKSVTKVYKWVDTKEEFRPAVIFVYAVYFFTVFEHYARKRKKNIS